MTLKQMKDVFPAEHKSIKRITWILVNENIYVQFIRHHRHLYNQ